MRKRYPVVIERASEQNWSAYSPDVPGCISTGATIEETERNFAEALAYHLEGTAEDGDPTPEPSTVVTYVEVEIPQPVTAG